MPPCKPTECGFTLQRQYDQASAGHYSSARCRCAAATMSCRYGQVMLFIGDFLQIVGAHLDDEHLAVQRQAVVGQDAQQLPLRDRLEELGAACGSGTAPLLRRIT